MVQELVETTGTPDEQQQPTPLVERLIERPVERVGVIGSGTMGAGIAELCAVSGLDVRLTVSRESSLAAAPARIAASLQRRVDKQKLSAEQRDAALARISVGLDLADLGDRQLVIEAVPENEALKLDLFGTLGKVVSDDAVLASTTSAISLTRLAVATNRPERVLGIHFFNPVTVLPLVELIPALPTDPDVVDLAEAFVTGTLGKQPIRSADRSGFVVNSLLIPYLLAAVRMVESGFATAESVDRGMELGCAHPLGPLRLADLIGLDVVVAIAESLYREFKEPLYAPPPSLSRMVESGLLGRKSGRGFHSYA
jgi:3-hydroxybutyryl-CoA dehydrogenase